MFGEVVIGFYFNRVCVKFCGKIFTDTLCVVWMWVCVCVGVNACIDWFCLLGNQTKAINWPQSENVQIYMSVCMFHLVVPSIFIQKKYLFASNWGSSGHSHAGFALYQ